MTLAEFIQNDDQIYPGPLRALWLAQRGQWQQAHEIAQSYESHEYAWVHAYLHRAEGDTANASYWYRRAGRPVESGNLQTEWETIVTSLLHHTN